MGFSALCLSPSAREHESHRRDRSRQQRVPSILSIAPQRKRRRSRRSRRRSGGGRGEGGLRVHPADPTQPHRSHPNPAGPTNEKGRQSNGVLLFLFEWHRSHLGNFTSQELYVFSAQCFLFRRLRKSPQYFAILVGHFTGGKWQSPQFSAKLSQKLPRKLWRQI